MKLKKLLYIPLFIFFTIGCTASSVYKLTIDEYMLAAPKIKLGMTKDEVVKILSPSQSRLENTEIKHPDMYNEKDVFVEIIYFRSGWQKDGIITDEEFTPYLFHDGKLVSVGWAKLGGAKSHAQSQPKTDVNTTTIVNPGPYIY